MFIAPSRQRKKDPMEEDENKIIQEGKDDVDAQNIYSLESLLVFINECG